MNLIDIMIIIIAGGCLVRGIFRGVVLELSSIIGAVAGFYIAYACYPRLAHFLQDVIPETALLNIVAFLMLFCGVFFLIGLLGLLIRKAMKTVFMGWLDRFLGGMIGVFKGGVIVAALLLALTVFLPDQTRLLKYSVLAPHIMTLPETLSRLTPKSVQRGFKSNIKEINEFWKQHSRKS